MWTISEEQMQQSDVLQRVIDCAEDGDVVTLPPATLFKPQHQVVVQKNISIEAGRIESRVTGGNDSKVWLTCPSGEGLFLVR